MKQVLTVAGSDSGGGAGIQADIKAIQANGAFAMSVITSVTAQNTREVKVAFDLPPDLVAAQMDAVFEDFEVAALKTGMLSSAEIVRIVAQKLREYRPSNLVIDPVMISKSGYRLLAPDAVEALKEELIPLAALITPNAHEAALLAGCEVRSPMDAERAAARIRGFGCPAVLVKGGHLEGEAATDVLYDGRTFVRFSSERIPTRHTHGTGCTYSAAIAAHLALGKGLADAVRAAKDYLTEAIRHAPGIGHGHGPVSHFYFLKRET